MHLHARLGSGTPGSRPGRRGRPGHDPGMLSTAALRPSQVKDRFLFVPDQNVIGLQILANVAPPYVCGSCCDIGSDRTVSFDTF